MKMKTLRFLLPLVFLAFIAAPVSAVAKVNPSGNWIFTASDAPYEYSSGVIVVEKEKKEYLVKIRFEGDYEVSASNVKYEDNELSFEVYLEGETVSLQVTVGKEEMNGTASYSQGVIALTAKKE